MPLYPGDYFTQSGLRCPAFAARDVARLQKADRCPCSASLHLPQAALRLRSLPPTAVTPRLHRRPLTGALNQKLLLLGKGEAKSSEPPYGGGPAGPGGKHTEALPAAETAEAEQGQPSKYASGLRPALHIWATATRGSAPVFASGRRGAPQKSAKRKRETRRPRPAFRRSSSRLRAPAGARPQAGGFI